MFVKNAANIRFLISKIKNMKQNYNYRSMIYIQDQNDDVIRILNYIQSFFIFM